MTAFLKLFGVHIALSKQTEKCPRAIWEMYFFTAAKETLAEQKTPEITIYS